MDEAWVAAGVAVVLVVGLCTAVWWLVASARRDRRRARIVAEWGRRYEHEAGFLDQQDRPAHLFCGQGEAVTVAELLEEAAEQGEGVRLNWSEESVDNAGRIRPYVQDQFPTAILPRVDFIEDREAPNQQQGESTNQG